MMVLEKYGIVLFSFLLIGLHSYAQEKKQIQKSTEIMNIGGKSYFMHHVEKGQTVYSILRVYKLGVDDFYLENPDAKAGLQIGQILRIPNNDGDMDQQSSQKQAAVIEKKEPPIPIPPTNTEKKGASETTTASQPKKQTKTIEHTVGPDETLESISNKYRISLDDIYATNPEARDGVRSGQKLKILMPKRAAVKKAEVQPPKIIPHTVARKETLYGISQKYQVSIDEIRKYNPGLKTRIRTGSILNIPTVVKEVIPEAAKARELSIETFQFGQLEVQLINSKHIMLKPGSNSNVAIKLLNSSNTAIEYLLKVQTPPGLSQLSDYSSVIVDREREKLKIFSFYVSEAAWVGDFEIIVDIWDKSENLKLGTLTIPVSILPRYEVLLKTMKAPEYVFSGDTMSVRFMIKNTSNVEATIKTDIINNNVSETRMYTLAPDSLVYAPVFISTSKDIDRYRRNSVNLAVSVVENPETTDKLSYIYDVIPSGKVKFDAYNRIPIAFSGLLVSDNQLGDRQYGAMFDVKGGGMLSKRKERSIDFHFRGPNRQGNPILGQTDEYYIAYLSKRSKAVVGDHSYSLTDLTEGMRNGRGAEYAHTFKKICVGSFINYPRFYPEITRVVSAYTSFTSGEKLGLKAGYLNKQYVTDSTAHLFTISGESMPFPWTQIKLEYATGLANSAMTKAYSAMLNLKILSYRFFFNYTMADKDFPGYMKNSQYLSSGLSATFFRKLNLSVNYNSSQINMALDTMYANAPASTNMSAALGYMIHYNHSISLGFNMRGREDKRTPKEFDYKEYTLRLTLQSRIKRFGINMYGAYGKMLNQMPLKQGEITDVLNANFSLQYKISDQIFAKAFVSYIGGQQYITSDFTRFFYGGTLSASFKKKVSVDFQYQNNYEVEEYYRDRSLLSLNAAYQIHKNHEIRIGTNYNLQKNYLNNTQLTASLKYTYTFHLPVSKRDDLGSVKGRVVNNGVESVEGILFTLAGNVAISDKNGAFDFPSVKTGTHFLFMDNSTSGLNTIAEVGGPYKMEILPGEEEIFEISLTKSGKITGSLSIEEDENRDKKGFIPIKEEIKNLIVEVKKDSEMYRVFTKKDGTFAFEDLRPGLWILKVYERGLPAGYQLVTDEFSINLASTEVKDVKVVIRKKSRKIKFQSKSGR